MTETVTIADPPAELRTEVENAVAVAGSYARITCIEQRQALGADLQANKRLQNEVEEERLKIAKPLTEASRAVNALFKRMSTPLEQSETMMKRAALAWDDEQDRIKARAVREAARKADEEKARLAAEAEKQRAAGNVETAHAIEAAAQMVAPVPVVVEESKVAGEAHADVWRAEIVNLDELLLELSPATNTRALLNADERMQCCDFFAKLFAPRARSLKNALSILASARSASASSNRVPLDPKGPAMKFDHKSSLDRQDRQRAVHRGDRGRHRTALPSARST